MQRNHEWGYAFRLLICGIAIIIGSLAGEHIANNTLLFNTVPPSRQETGSLVKSDHLLARPVLLGAQTPISQKLRRIHWSGKPHHPYP
jgi:hypothetical protein